MKMSILGTVFVLACALSASASATNLCAVTDGKAQSVDVPAGSFVKLGFKAKCSANVWLDGIDSSSTVYAVGSGSAKGKKYFTGNTAGGAVRAVADCPISGCTGTESGLGATQGVTDAAST